jgi:hypothetical protein
LSTTVAELYNDLKYWIGDEVDAISLINMAIRFIAKRLYVLRSEIIVDIMEIPIYAQVSSPAFTNLSFASSSGTISLPNLLTNGNFETLGAGGQDVFGGDWSESWGTGTTEAETVNVHSGSYAVKMSGNGQGVSQAITTGFSVGESLTLNFWTRGDGTYAGRYSITRPFLSDIVSLVTTGISGTAYQEVTVTFTVPAATTQININLYPPSNVSGTAYFDDVWLGGSTNAGFYNSGFRSEMSITTDSIVNPGPFRIFAVTNEMITVYPEDSLIDEIPSSSIICNDSSFGFLPIDFWGLVDDPYLNGRTWYLIPLPGTKVGIQYQDAGVPIYYKIRGDKFYVTPKTSEDFTIKADYFYKPTTIQNTTDTLPWNDIFNDIIYELVIAYFKKSGILLPDIIAAINSGIDAVAVRRGRKAPHESMRGIVYEDYK